MRIMIIILLLLPLPFASFAAGGGGVPLLEANVDITDEPSLQRGAKLFVNYCLSCHSARYMRYSQMGQGLGLTKEQVRENLMFAAEKVTEPMKVAMSSSDAKRWFGTAPPDLSVIARSRGADWLYTYLLSFYKDEDPARAYGVNNLVFKDVGMPDVLWKLRGIQVPVYKEVHSAHGDTVQVIDRLQLETPGTMTPVEFHHAMRDLMNFLVFLGEPAQATRYRIGMWVLLFLVLFFVVSYALYKEYWKDVH